MAHRSVRKVIRRLGRPARNRSPSSTEARLRVSPSCRSSRSGSIEGSRHIAYREAVKVTASTVYAARYPHQPTISPPSIGPTSAPVVVVMELSALAAGSCPGGSSRAIIEERAGALSAKQTAWRATIA